MFRPRSWPNTFFKSFLLFLSTCRPLHPIPSTSGSAFERDTLPVADFSWQDPIFQAESLRKAFVSYAKPRVGWLRVKATYRYRETRMEGSAWYWKEPGLWVSCAHLFPHDNPQTLEIELWDAYGNCRVLQRPWRDSLADVAFLRDTHAVGFVKSEVSSEVGDWCFTMGAPLGLSFSFQEGYVVAERRIEGQSYYQLTFWAAPGSSGSPVLNRSGHVIAMIAQIAPVGSNDLGIAFALPVQRVLEAYRRYSTFARHDSSRAHTGD